MHGTVTEISPQRRYYIKTKGGRVLVRNRRFLRRRVPTSIPLIFHKQVLISPPHSNHLPYEGHPVTRDPLDN